MNSRFTPYRDFWTRLFLSVILALFFTFLGSDSITDIVYGENFIPDVLAGFILIFIITTLINLISSYLDIYYPWTSNILTRVLYQFITGVVITSFFVLAYMYAYLLVIREYKKEEVSFFNNEFPIAIVFIIIWNLVYVTLYIYRINKKQKEELLSLNKQLFTLQNVITGTEIPPSDSYMGDEETSENDSNSIEDPDSEKINILIAVSGNKNIPLPIEKIAYFYKKGNYTRLVTFKSESYLLNHSLDELMNVLDTRRFFRANRQFIINLDACHYFTNEENGKLALSLMPEHDEEVIVSQKRAPAFKEWLNK